MDAGKPVATPTRSSPTQTSAATKGPAATKSGTPPPAEVSPGDGAFHPPTTDAMKQDRRDDERDGSCDDAFGPPPAFPSASKAHGKKRKRTLMAVSASAGNGAPLGDLSSEDDDDDNGGKSETRQSQVIHRIKHEARSPEREETEKYEDAMLLASLSDVDSPKKQEDSVSSGETAAAVNTVVAQLDREEESEANARQEDALSPPRSSNSSGGTASTAATPLRSNVNPNHNLASPSAEGTGVVKPFPLQPKPQAPPNHHHHPHVKRGKYSEGNTLTVVAPAPQTPDGRDPKAVKVKKEGIREGYAPQQPHLSSGPPPPGMPGPYPPGYHPGYPSPFPPGGPSPYGPTSGPPAYPPGYPYRSSYPPSYPPGPPGSAMGGPSPYYPRAYYPGQYPPSGGPPPSQGVTPERWGHYHSPKLEPKERGTREGGPEPVRSDSRHPRYNPLPSSSSRQSHVVPSEDGDAGAPESVYGRAPPAPYGPGGPPPPGYPMDSRYGAPPPTREGYYPGPGAPPPAEYPAVSRDESSPPRSSQALAHPEYPPAVNTPPRGHYDYYHEQQAGAGAPPGYGAPPPSQGYHPDTPPGSVAYSPYSRGGPPPPSHDPYEPYDYTAPSPNEAHYHVPAAVSNETESPHHAGPGATPGPPPPSSTMGGGKYHQFRKGGRSVHSEPVVLRKKFSWRNYPELEEYLIANRTDYLRHSALNYTAEQKHFNNRLTEGLLELAAKLNYVFDETCFNFVAVRDRIRCYYKSYVQSSKKRGVVVGFAKPPGKKEHEGHDAVGNGGRDSVMGEA